MYPSKNNNFRLCLRVVYPNKNKYFRFKVTSRFLNKSEFQRSNENSANPLSNYVRTKDDGKVKQISTVVLTSRTSVPIIQNIQIWATKDENPQRPKNWKESSRA